MVDTTGAGDAFAAGFLFGWCGSRDVQRGLVYGCACGTAAVGQVGGSTPLDAAAVDATMRRNEGITQCSDLLSYREEGSLEASGAVVDTLDGFLVDKETAGLLKGTGPTRALPIVIKGNQSQ